MAGPGTAQERLDKIVRNIAANMVADVCSIYLLRSGSRLELFATEGLNPEAVHKAFLKVGEGLVGTIAETALPLSLPDAQSHPKFAYLPETGEEIYHSLMGVPIIRAGRVVGVVVVQNRTMREYDEDEIDALQTIAMVLAELVGQGDLVDPAEYTAVDSRRSEPYIYDGVGLAEGLAMGVAVLHEPRVAVDRLIAEDPQAELNRLATAISSLRRRIDAMLADEDMVPAGEHRDILETYRMFAHDRGWRDKIEEAIKSGLTAEAAVERVQMETRARMGSVTDPYLRERLSDLEDLANRLMRHLVGKSETAAGEVLPEEAILIARTMGPAELLDYDRSRLKAVVMEEGSPTSHVAIVARGLGIPLVGGCERVLERIEPGDVVVADGDTGQVIFRPSPEVSAAFAENLRIRVERRAEYAQYRNMPAVSRDGIAVKLYMNAGLHVDLPHLDETGADGIGLFRTELQFMVSATMPRLAAQIELYAQVLNAAGERPVIFRTLDVGGDKVLPYMVGQREENPALGWRAIRLVLDRPALLRYQLRALLIAGAGKTLSVMFPMVADVAEFRQARQILEVERRRLERLGRPLPAAIRVGTMLEVPALAYQLPALLPLVDFISIGSNDLLQFFFAADRGNPKVSGRYDLLAPSALKLLRDICATCTAADVPVSLCGEMAGRPLEAMALFGLGFRSISMNAVSIGPVKAMLRGLNVGEFRAYLERLIDGPDRTLRGKIESFARDHGVAI
ncbi:phosphoenolpyruvate--protein phosphotransferase [Zavarzinia sp.]|uniref:phosphoenolpyruvate--protein phosphotransferase n=1 Tax=Zavarzinia sp. TaxID=2027920 RepID=UPI00356178F6